MRADRDRQQVRLGAGVGEPHALQPEAVAHGAGELRLDQVAAAEVDAGIQRAIHRGADLRMRMAIDPRGVLAEEIDVFGAVEVPQPAALAARDADRERRVVQHGARVAAGHHRGRLDKPGKALRIARHIGFLRLGQRRIDVGVAQFRLAHGVLRSVVRSLPVGYCLAQPMPHSRQSDRIKGRASLPSRTRCGTQGGHHCMAAPGFPLSRE